MDNDVLDGSSGRHNKYPWTARQIMNPGGFPVPLAGRTAFSLKFAPETVGALRLANAPGVSVAVRSRDCAALSGATGGFAPGGGSGQSRTNCWAAMHRGATTSFRSIHI
jgi:hypothetical protein